MNGFYQTYVSFTFAVRLYKVQTKRYIPKCTENQKFPLNKRKFWITLLCAGVWYELKQKSQILYTLWNCLMNSGTFKTFCVQSYAVEC